MINEEILSVLILGENVVIRHRLTDLLNNLEGVEVAGVAATGKITLAKLERTRIDLVLFDVDIKESDPLQTLAAIRELHPDVSVVMLSAPDSTSAVLAVKALEMGALDIVAKPELVHPGDRDWDDFQKQLAAVFRTLGGKRHIRRVRTISQQKTRLAPARRTASPESARPQPASIIRPTLSPARPPARIDLVLIGVSTGGPNALSEVIPKLPADLGAPILLVQHMPQFFTEALAKDLDRRSALTVHEGFHGQEVLPNHIYIAPGGRHMVLRRSSPPEALEQRYILGLNDDPPVNSCRPAVDVLFTSTAKVTDGNVLAVIMTGMGSDGTEGVRALKEKNCYCLTQSEETCVVYSMPRSVVEAGLSDEQIHLGDMAARIADIVRREKFRSLAK